jgi:hypothetical protein
VYLAPLESCLINQPASLHCGNAFPCILSRRPLVSGNRPQRLGNNIGSVGTKQPTFLFPIFPSVLLEAEPKNGFQGLIVEDRNSERLREAIYSGT